MSLVSALNVGTKAISASQLAIDVTGQNIANANTEGYSRKRVDVFSENRKDPILGEMGTGVGIGSVERIRNIFLDKEAHTRLTEKGYFEELNNMYERVENTFIEPSESSLSGAMNNFWNSWQELSNNPRDLSSRQAVRATTQVMIGQFHTIAAEMRDMRLSINDDIEAHIKLVNGYAKDIKNLNDEVAATEAGGGTNANDSRDRREVVLKKLASEIEISWFEDDQGRVTVTTGGTILVSPDIVNPLDGYRKTQTELDGTTSSDLVVRHSMNNNDTLLRGGAIKGLVEARDVLIPKYEAALNEIAATMVEAVNDVHRSGYNLSGATGISFFDGSKTLAINISLSASIDADVNNIASTGGGVLSSPAGGPVSVTLPAGYPVTTTEIDLKTINSQYSNVERETMVITDGSGNELEEGAGHDYVVNYETGVISFINTSRFAAGNTFSVDFRYNDTGFGGKGDGSNAQAIAKLQTANLTQPDQTGTATQSIGEYYSAFIGQLGIERNEANAQVETRKFVLDQINKRQAEISGVSLDEEMANMIKFEHSYQAAARYMSTVSQLMDTLLGIGG